MDLSSMLPDSAVGWVNALGLLVACSSGAALAISKLTKNTADDKLAGYLKKAHDLLGFVGLHGQSMDEKRVTQSKVDEAVAAGKARDHRKVKR